MPFLSVGQINFLPYTATSVGSWPETVCIADINNDGLNDVIMGTAFYFDPANDHKIFVFIQNAQGNLNAPFKFAYTNDYSDINSMQVKDVNNDNLNDLVFGYGDSVGIFFQNNSGVLDRRQSFYSGNNVDGIKCGDLNNDGLTDIVASHWNGSDIRVFYQTNTGFISSVYSKPFGGYDEIDVGDVNGDGLNDVVFMSGQGAGGIHVFTQNNSGTLNNYVSYFPAGNSWTSLHGIAIGDLNNDGKNDVVASMGGNSPNAHVVVWYQNTITHSLQSPPVEIDAYDIPEPIEIDDVNCDGKNEIITAHGGWTDLSVYTQVASNSYNDYQKFNIPYASHYNPYGLSIGDLNNDGRKDIAVADYNSGMILLMNDSRPVLYTPFSTAIHQDTAITSIYNIITTAAFHTVDTFVNNKYEIIVRDSFIVNTTFRVDSIRVDSFVIKVSNMCAVQYFDTFNTSVYYTYNRFIKYDTILVRHDVDSLNLIKSFSILPNPTNNIFTIELPAPYDTNDLTITIYNSIGQSVLRQLYSGNTNRIILDISGYANGTYVVSLSQENQKSINKKILKVP